MRERFIITADPPTANGDLHVGHLSGPYLAADALTRFLRLQGHDVSFYSNLDPHQTYVQTTALKLGKTADEVADLYDRRIRDTFAAYSVDLDLFAVPDQRQKDFVNEFFARLHDQGKLRVKEESLPYCSGCERYLFQAYIEGTCPHCSAPCFGNNCEACARPNSPIDMGQPVCRVCSTPATESRSYKGFYMPLSDYQTEIRQYLLTRKEVWRPRGLEVVLPLIDEGTLPDIPLTFPSDHGLPVDIPGFEGQIWNIRLELFPAIVNTFDKWRDLQEGEAWDWRDNDDYKVVHFHGIDNVFQYSTMFNSMLLASDQVWQLPYANLTNEFCLLDGKKFSTTRNYAVWAGDILDVVSSDPLRFYLAYINPELGEANFVLSEFRDTTDRLLTGPWNKVHAVLNQLTAEDWRLATTATPREDFAPRLQELTAELEKCLAIESLSLRRTAHLLSDWLGDLEQSVEDLSQASHDDPQRGPALATLLAGVRALAVFATPVIPTFAARLSQALGQDLDWQAHRRPLGAAIDWPDDLALRPVAEADLDACAYKGPA